MSDSINSSTDLVTGIRSAVADAVTALQYEDAVCQMTQFLRTGILEVQNTIMSISTDVSQRKDVTYVLGNLCHKLDGLLATGYAENRRVVSSSDVSEGEIDLF